MRNGPSEFPRESAEPTPDFPPSQEPSIRELLRQVAEDSRELLREEIALAKLELQEKVSALKVYAAAIAVGIGLLVLGGLTLTAFLVIGLGALLGGAYWLSTLIVAIVCLGLGTLLAIRGAKKIGPEELTPEKTIRSLDADRRWLKEEAEDFRNDLAS